MKDGDASIFLAILKSEGIPEPVMEHKFYPGRGWRFDFAWPDLKVALEVEGGVWMKGRHTRGPGYIADMEKYNMATLEGWRLLRFTPQQLTNRLVPKMLKELMSRE